jgi:hypothetical protein
LTGAIVVEQLNHCQWHVVSPRPGHLGGAVSWVDAVADALVSGWAYELPVESLDLDGNRLILAHAERVI